MTPVWTIQLALAIGLAFGLALGLWAGRDDVAGIVEPGRPDEDAPADRS